MIHNLTHAMVLAAGMGMRMRPLTLTCPKPLLPVAGRTMLDRALDHLAQHGVENVVVNTHYLANKIEQHLAPRTAPAITLSHEPERLETGGGIANALPLLGPAPFFVMNADVVIENGPTPLLQRLEQAWDDTTMDCLMLLIPKDKAVGYGGHGDYHCDAKGRLSRPEGGAEAPYVCSGVYIVHPRLFTDLPGLAFSMLVLWERLARKGRLYGVIHDGGWYHAGTPDDLERVNQLLSPERLTERA